MVKNGFFFFFTTWGVSVVKNPPLRPWGSQRVRQDLATEQQQQHNCVTKGEYSPVKIEPEGHIYYLADSEHRWAWESEVKKSYQ